MAKEGKRSALFNLRVVYGLLTFAKKGYLSETGWTESYRTKTAVDAEGRPIPWLTYSFLDFIKNRLDRSVRMFEYGSGNSTLYFHNYVGHISSVEHDRPWYDKVLKELPAEVDLRYVPLGSHAYAEAILGYEESFDLVLIDGRERLTCLHNAIQRLSKRGVIVFDDMEREKYAGAFAFMEKQGFRYIPFTGIAIGAIHHKNTCVFYRDNNVLGI